MLFQTDCIDGCDRFTIQFQNPDMLNQTESQQLWDLFSDDDQDTPVNNQLPHPEKEAANPTAYNYEFVESLLNKEKPTKRKRKYVKKSDSKSSNSEKTELSSPVDVVTSSSSSIICNPTASGSRLPYLMEYHKRYQISFNSYDMTSIRSLVDDVFTPDATWMTPKLKFVNAKTALPSVTEAMISCVPDMIMYTYPPLLVYGRVIKLRCISSGSYVGEHAAESLWNSVKYTSPLTTASVHKAKADFDQIRSENRIPSFTNEWHIALVLNEELSHIIRQINLLYRVEVTNSVKKSQFT